MGPPQICIPVSHSDSVVAVPLDQLPDDPDELLDILKAEEAPLQLWLEFAKAYLSQVCRVNVPASSNLAQSLLTSTRQLSSFRATAREIYVVYTSVVHFTKPLRHPSCTRKVRPQRLALNVEPPPPHG
jgi:hypothetical protein